MPTFVQFKLVGDTTTTSRVRNREEKKLIKPLTAKEFRFVDGPDENEHIINKWPDDYFKDISEWKKIAK